MPNARAAIFGLGVGWLDKKANENEVGMNVAWKQAVGHVGCGGCMGGLCGTHGRSQECDLIVQCEAWHGWRVAGNGPRLDEETTMLYVIIVDGAFDQVVETKALAQKEKRDLMQMGCEVKIKPVKDWTEANELENRMAGK